MLTGDNGLLTKSNEATKRSSHAQIKEAMTLAYNEYQIAIKTKEDKKEVKKVASTGTIKLAVSNDEVPATFWDFLLEKGMIDENGKINTEALLNTETKLGNGTGETDVYKLEKEDETYVVNYYGSNGSETELIWQVIAEAQLFTYQMNDDGQTITITGVKEKYKTEKYAPIVDEKGNEVTTLVIPAFIDGYPVTVIGVEAFQEIGGFSSVIISEGITEISTNVFSMMWTDGLSIYIPSSVSVIKGPIAYFDSPGLIFNCASDTKPDGWADDWSDNRESIKHVVNWGVKGVSR